MVRYALWYDSRVSYACDYALLDCQAHRRCEPPLTLFPSLNKVGAWLLAGSPEKLHRKELFAFDEAVPIRAVTESR